MFKIANDPKYDGYQRRLVSMAYKIFDKKSSGRGVDTSLANKSATTPNYQLANELHRQIIRIFKGRKVYSSFRDNIWGADLADMPSFSKYNKGIKYLLFVIDFFSKYAWVVPLKEKLLLLMHFIKQSPNDANEIKYGLIRVVIFTIIF